jgi:hypothetical protein
VSSLGIVTFVDSNADITNSSLKNNLYASFGSIITFIDQTVLLKPKHPLFLLVLRSVLFMNNKVYAGAIIIYLSQNPKFDGTTIFKNKIQTEDFYTYPNLLGVEIKKL